MLRGLVAVVACALVIDASADERPGIPTWRSLEGAPAASRVWGDGHNLYAITPGGALHRSSDRGASWRIVPGVRARGVFGTAPTDVWAVSERGVAHSTDRGVTWKLETLAMLGHAAVMEGGWSAGSHVFVVGTDRGSDGVHRAAIVHSRDGGMSWRSELLPVELARIGGVWGSAANDVYAVGSRGAILHSTGDGVWQVRRAPTGTGSLDGVWGSDAASVYAVGTSGAILHSGDRGKTWSPRASGATYALTSIVGVGNEIFVGSNAGPPLRSIDGRAWRPVTAMLARGHVWPSDSDQLYAVTATGIEYFGAGPSTPVAAAVPPTFSPPRMPAALQPYLSVASTPCDFKLAVDHGDWHERNGNNTAALASFKGALACRFDPPILRRAILVACRTPDAVAAKELFKGAPTDTALLQHCIAKGIDPRACAPNCP